MLVQEQGTEIRDMVLTISYIGCEVLTTATVRSTVRRYTNVSVANVASIFLVKE
jgi:hypothetical protein